MKLKEKITMISILSLSNVALFGMGISNTADMINRESKVVELQMATLHEAHSEHQEKLTTYEDKLTTYETKLVDIEEKIGNVEEELSQIKKQPTIDNSDNDIEETVELNPVEEQPVVSAPQTIQEKEKPKENTSTVKEVNVRVSFYTSLASENGGYAGMNAINGRLSLGSISAPKSIPFGSIISIPEMQNLLGITEFTVDDRGGAIYVRDDGVYKLDVYVPQRQGESDNDYFNRVNNMGIVNTKAKIYFK